MIENMGQYVDEDRTSAALLTDLSKTLDCHSHNLLITKLHAHSVRPLSLLRERGDKIFKNLEKGCLLK